MPSQPAISLIVPTRRRVRQLARLLESLAATISRRDAVEVVVVVDEDDAESQAFRHDGVALQKVVVPCGLPMGALNMAGYEESTGRCIMLLNDDVSARTPAWDLKVLECFNAFPDDMLLVHVNDMLFRESLCTFPLVSRAWCEMAGGICPREYRRYRIDDHIGDVFNLLGLLGERRIVYLPDVLFEHFHYDEPEVGQRRYAFNPEIMAEDAPRFEALRDERKALALRVKRRIDDCAQQAADRERQRVLDGAADAFTLRLPQRLRVRGKSPDATRARVAIGVASPVRPQPVCVDALRAHSPGAELIVLEGGSDDFRPGREWNRLLHMTRSDYLVLSDGRSRVGPSWLPRLLAAMTGDVIAATPLHRTESGELMYDGIAAWSEAIAPPGVRALMAPSGGLMILDAVRARQLLFDERFRRYGADIDFGLRGWEAGWKIVCAPQVLAVRLNTIDEGPFPAPPQDLFEADRRLLLETWEASERTRRFDEHLAEGLRDVRRLLQLGGDIPELLQRGRRESPRAYRERAERAVEDLRSFPVLADVLAAAAAHLLGSCGSHDIDDPRTGHLAWLLRLVDRRWVADHRPRQTNPSTTTTKRATIAA
jgi:GT2 family glycosyltransferase